MKLRSGLVLFYFISLFNFQSCKDGENGNNPIAPPSTSEKVFGLRGVVKDTSGKLLENVNVRCLYYTNYIAPDVEKPILLPKTSATNSFDFNLEQNFPNPFSNSTYLRYSFPEKSFVSLAIISKFNNEKVYHYSDTISGGYYQRYLGNIVDSLQLQNGLYRYTLITKNMNGISDTASKELFVLSDKGKPNSITDNLGNYFFDYNQSFAGDSVVIKSSSNYSYKTKLNNIVNLRFEKEGYDTQTISFTLYPNILINHDIVLMKK